MLIHARAVLFAALFTTLHFTSGVCPAAEPPVNIIFDTDMGGDCDDVGALFILHGAVERGDAQLLAMNSGNICSVAPTTSAVEPNTRSNRCGLMVQTVSSAPTWTGSRKSR